MSTKAEVRGKVGLLLGIKPAGQALSNRYSSDLDDAYDEVHANLEALDLVTWASAAEVPAEFVSHVVALIALSRVTEYSVSGNRLNNIVSAASQAKNRIRELISDPYFNNAEGAVYF